jgi:hypothetical protein
VYSSELAEDEARGVALAQEFQSNIFGLTMAFAINLFITISLGKQSQWAWRVPIMVMQIYPALLFSVAQRLPETPRWFITHDKKDKASEALEDIYGNEDTKSKLEELISAKESESGQNIGYSDMLIPNGSQFHPTVVTFMGQVNQALTGYGAVSVYGPQIFELLGFTVRTSEYLTLGNYVSYFFMMTLAWLLIDRVGRRILMISNAFIISICFAILTLLGGLAMNSDELNISNKAVAIPGAVILYLATASFGIGWLSTVWLIPTEIYPSTARAQGAAISVVVWGLANFAVTLLTPIGFNNLKYWLFLVFAITNELAGWWTWVSLYSLSAGSFLIHQRHTLPKLEVDLSKKTKAFSRVPRRRIVGWSQGSKMENSSICRVPRKAAVEMERQRMKTRLCWDDDICPFACSVLIHNCHYKRTYFQEPIGLLNRHNINLRGFLRGLQYFPI